MISYEELNAQQEVSEKDPFTSERYQQFYGFFPANVETVLDIGCNTGRGGQVLKKLNQELKIFGLDCVRDRLNKLPNTIYEQGIYGLSTNIPCDDYKFDVVVAGEFIEHISPSDVDRTLIEIFRVLKIGGRFLLTTPNPSDLKKRIRNESVLGGAHISQHFHDTLKLKLRSTGYSRIKVYGSGKVTRYLGYYFPYLHVYGSYLMIGDKK
ncbi:class I SAM-dependent methyltransferase [Mastigocoleus testarum]|uniref:Ubiquinone/menaquinone biosynthesis protein n=1 Tax=Mastigocoleus testarum BC008 TaxID=371196 RepID=A0A0V7ZUC6_9CYAN|nr:class I SAM-dependent methyltransferase [Mastigocoleus testarum]KST67759.1 ubiquinone/menaquinone biosynthesis protein [Mastigocoleus testarum BC008]